MAKHSSIRAAGVAAALAGALALGASWFGAPTASASNGLTPHWSHVGSACAPDEASVGRFDVHTSTFAHTATSTGSIVARCNIVPILPSGDYTTLEVVYKDPDGKGTAYRVRAMLIRAQDSDGSATTELVFDSNNFDGTGLQKQSVVIQHGFDFADNAYYVDIRVERTSTAGAPALQVVRLNQTIG